MPGELRVERSGEHVVGQQELVEDAIGGAVQANLLRVAEHAEHEHVHGVEGEVGHPGHAHDAGATPFHRVGNFCDTLFWLGDAAAMALPPQVKDPALEDVPH